MSTQEVIEAARELLKENGISFVLVAYKKEESAELSDFYEAVYRKDLALLDALQFSHKLIERHMEVVGVAITGLIEENDLLIDAVKKQKGGTE